MANYPKIIPVTSSYLEHWAVQQCLVEFTSVLVRNVSEFSML